MNRSNTHIKKLVFDERTQEHEKRKEKETLKFALGWKSLHLHCVLRSRDRVSCELNTGCKQDKLSPKLKQIGILNQKVFFTGLNNGEVQRWSKFRDSWFESLCSESGGPTIGLHILASSFCLIVCTGFSSLLCDPLATSILWTGEGALGAILRPNQDSTRLVV